MKSYIAGINSMKSYALLLCFLSFAYGESSLSAIAKSFSLPNRSAFSDASIAYEEGIIRTDVYLRNPVLLGALMGLTSDAYGDFFQEKVLAGKSPGKVSLLAAWADIDFYFLHDFPYNGPVYGADIASATQGSDQDVVRVGALMAASVPYALASLSKSSLLWEEGADSRRIKLGLRNLNYLYLESLFALVELGKERPDILSAEDILSLTHFRTPLPLLTEAQAVVDTFVEKDERGELRRALVQQYRNDEMFPGCELFLAELYHPISYDDEHVEKLEELRGIWGRLPYDVRDLFYNMPRIIKYDFVINDFLKNLSRIGEYHIRKSEKDISEDFLYDISYSMRFDYPENIKDAMLASVKKYHERINDWFYNGKWPIAWQPDVQAFLPHCVSARRYRMALDAAKTDGEAAQLSASIDAIDRISWALKRYTTLKGTSPVEGMRCSFPAGFSDFVHAQIDWYERAIVGLAGRGLPDAYIDAHRENLRFIREMW